MFQYRVALVRELPATFDQCISMEKPMNPIDVKLAKQQHGLYNETIKSLVPEFIKIDADERMPDCCFIEDPLLVIGKKVILNNINAPSRNGEVEQLKELFEEMKKNGKIETYFQMKGDAFADGGDILVLQDEILIGLSKRTNPKGVAFIQSVFPDVKIRTFNVQKGLHLKSLMSAMDESTIVMEDTEQGHQLASQIQIKDEKGIDKYKFIFVPDPLLANVLRIHDAVFVTDGFPNSDKILIPEIESRGLKLFKMPNSEIRKADGALTCCSAFIH